MEEGVEALLKIPVPSLLTPENFRKESRPWVALVNKDGARYFGFHFLPLPTVERIEVDFAPLRQATASGLCELLSFIDWLREQTTVPIHHLSADRLTPFGLDSNGNVMENGGSAFPLPPTRVPIAPFQSVKSQTGQEHRATLGRWAEYLTQKLMPSESTPESDVLMRKAVVEFLREGLLNAYEHAFAETGEGGSVRVAASFHPINMVAEDVWGAWQRKHGGGKADRVLEIAIVDNGASVPEMLGDSYSKQRGALRRGRATLFHDAILEYAFSASGTRKTSADFASETIRQGWRGLHRILHRTEALEGRTILRSGLGLYGYGYAGRTSLHVKGAEIGGTAFSPTSALPGTTLCMRIALPLRARPIDKAPKAKFSLPNDVQRVLWLVPPSYWQETGTVHERIDSYVKGFSLGLHEEVAKLAAGKTPGLVIMEIIHPGVLLKEYHVDGDRTMWNAIALMMAENTRPDFIPLHYFFHIPSDDLVIAHKEFLELCESREFDVPALCGLHSIQTGEYNWFVFIPGQREDSVTLSLRREVTDTRPKSWWKLLESVYGSVVTIATGPGSAKLTLKLPLNWSEQTREKLLGYLVRGLAEERGAAWYWRAADGERTLVRTRGGKMMRSYVAAFSLCLNEPVVQMAIIALLDAQIGHLLKGSCHRILLVPDSTSEPSYLLAKRLRAALNLRDNVVVVHGSHLAKARQKGDAVLVFTDAVHTSESISKRVRAEYDGASSPELVFTCLDLRPQEIEWPKDLPPLVSAIRWAFPMPTSSRLPPGFALITIDALTNEIRPVDEDAETRSAARCYDSLAWHNSCHEFPSFERMEELGVSPEKVMPPDSIISYGLRRADGHLHVARCEVGRALEDTANGFRDLVARWLAAVISSLTEVDEDRDVVFFYRDDCGLQPHQASLVVGVLDYLSKIGRPLKGTVAYANLSPTRNGKRPVLRHHPSAQLFDGAQPVQLPRNHQMSLVLERKVIRDGYLAVFIDSAASSGRTIRDFILPMAEFDVQPRPGVLVLCPLVSRLPTSEEKLLLRTERLKTGWGGELPMHFAALLQVRCPNYPGIDLMPGLTVLRDLLVRIDETWHGDIRQWKNSVLQKLDRIAAQVDEAEAFPLYDGSSQNTVSLDALLIRQLLSVHQEGQPVLSPLVTRFREAVITKKDPSILVILSLEPELLNEEVLSGSFRDDITALALGELKGSHASIGSCALWVLYCMGEPFVRHQEAIASRCGPYPFLRGQWLSLVQTFSNPGRDHMIKEARKALKALLPKGDDELRKTLSQCRAMLDLWRNFSPVNGMPHDLEGAKLTISRFLREARQRHEDVGFPLWHKVTEDILAVTGELPRLSVDHWSKAEAFMDGFILPTLQAIVIFGESHSATAIHSAKIIAKEAFERARNVYKEGSASQFAAAWNDVRDNTLAWSVEWTFSDNPHAIVGRDEKGMSPSGGVLDRMLPDVVQEPIGLLLHTLASEFLDSAFTVEVDIPPEMKKLDPVKAFGAQLNVEISVFLGEMWKEAQIVTLVWGRSVKRMQAIAKLIAGNIKRHGDTTVPCRITARLRQDDSRDILDLHVSNAIRAKKTPGNGKGLQQISQWIDSVSGSLECLEIDSLFTVKLSIPVDILDLAEPL